MDKLMEHNKIIISPIAYIKSILYFQRFTSEFISEENFKSSYALLVGFIDPLEKETVITDFVPIKDFQDKYIDFTKDTLVLEKIAKVNHDFDDDEFPEYVLGWARNTVMNDLEPITIDKKNHLIFQTAIDPQAIFWIFNYDNLMIDDGFRLYSFQENFKSINLVSELKELRYDFSKNVYFDDLMDLAIQMEEKRKSKKILIKGIGEK